MSSRVIAGNSVQTTTPSRRPPQDGEEHQELAEICRAAVARWVTRREAEQLAAALARYSARPPRPAAGDGHLLLPGMRRATWYRTARLVEARAVEEFGTARPGPKPQADEPRTAAEVEARAEQAAAAEWRRAFTARGVRQMIGMLGDYADDKGHVENIGKFIACYRKAFGCSEATAYAHWRVVRELGLVRQTRHSAGHRPPAAGGQDARTARYVLCWPAARLPEDLPEEADAQTAAPLSGAVAAWDEYAAAALAGADEIGLYRYGACRDSQAHATGTAAAPVENQRPSAYYLEAWPLYARVSPPSPPAPYQSGEERSRRRRPGGLTEDDRAQAVAILNRCRSRWAEQGQELSEEEIAQLSGMVALVSRYSAHVHPGDLVDILTERVRSARDLHGLLRYRLQAVLRDLRRRRNLPVDHHGARHAAYAAQLAAKRADALEASAASRAQARAAAAAARARVAARQTGPESRRRSALRAAMTEPENAFAAELTARGITSRRPRPSASGRAADRAAEAAALRRASILGQVNADLTGPGHSPPPPLHQAFAADLPEHLLG
ncbi:hypothetical protein [Actinomadura sp. WAC 06369]|uniref:hypothetical protein n=1 Tax=Actinomadura sp. WAC 06369 TaxID=2203193 RepID=UPI000F7A94EE|nr:hypothetical protein [Actinomadura sp. WAC 06369]RSN46561.1 hypothetical protein DMH08_35690 [Actinomadura sp. WAC 06369]